MVDLSICQLLKDNRNENKTKVIVENKGKYLQNFFMQWVQSFSFLHIQTAARLLPSSSMQSLVKLLQCYCQKCMHS